MRNATRCSWPCAADADDANTDQHAPQCVSFVGKSLRKVVVKRIDPSAIAQARSVRMLRRMEETLRCKQPWGDWEKTPKEDIHAALLLIGKKTDDNCAELLAAYLDQRRSQRQSEAMREEREVAKRLSDALAVLNLLRHANERCP